MLSHFSTASAAWIVRNYRIGKSVMVPALFAGFFFVSAYLYLILVGRNVPLWVYGFVLALIVVGLFSTVKKIKSKIRQ